MLNVAGWTGTDWWFQADATMTMSRGSVRPPPVCADCSAPGKVYFAYLQKND